MADGVQDNQNIQADNNSIAFGGISVGGNVGDIRIGHTIGYTSEQVSTLITQISTTFQPKPFDGRSPYKGLDVFEEEDAELFFGREKLVEDLVGRVKESRTLFVTGPSGSGKSSLVRAGLIHALKQGGIQNLSSERWLYATLKPGRDPFEAMAGAFSRLKSPELGDYLLQNASRPEVLHKCAESTLSERSDQRLILFIDQFEEIFTQLNKDRAQAFIELLAHAADVENGRVIILFAMRSDFIPNCVIYPKLNTLLNRQFVQIGAMQGDELVSAIAQPALRVGLRIDPDLIAQIINDMHGEPGALPLMQFALKDLFDFQQAQGGMIALTLNDYLQRGGIRKALERHADNSFNKLNGHERKLTRAIFSSLIEIGRGTVDTRRTAIFDELVPASARNAEVEAIVRKLADARLLTTDEVAGKDTVTISHETLIDAWPWLKKLVSENRDVIAAQNEIAKDAKEWDDHGRDPSYLYSGARLEVAQEQLSANKIVLSGLSKEFLEEGIALREAERKAKESLRRRITMGLISGIAIALVLAGFAVYQMFQARDQATRAQSGELSAEAVALRHKRFQLSLLLGIEAYKEPISNQSYEALLENVQSHPQLSTFLSGHMDAVASVAFSPDGKTLASGSRDGTVILWNAQTAKAIRKPLTGHTDDVTSIAFSPDGKILASGSRDTTIILWDVETGALISQLQEHSDDVTSVAFSPDGKILASGSRDITIMLWDVETGALTGGLVGHFDYVTSVAFSPDGKMLASGSKDETITLWDVQTATSIRPPLTGHIDYVTSVAFSPDGKTLASGSRDTTVILWDVETGEPLGQPLKGHVKDVASVAFSPDGKTLASSSRDTTIILWDVETGEPLGQPLRGHVDSIFSYVTSVAFSPDGKTLASGSSDTTIILWDVAMSTPISQPLKEHIYGKSNLTFSQDSKTLVFGSSDGMITLWDVAEDRSIQQSPIPNASSLTFSPDGKTLAYGNNEGTLTLWDVGAGSSLGQTLEGDATTLTFSPDGKRVAFGTNDRKIMIWDISAGKLISQFPEANVDHTALSPDGRTLAIVSGTTIKLLDVTTGIIDHSLEGHTQVVTALAFSPDGKTLASGSNDTTIILWDVKTGNKGQPLEGHTQPVTTIVFSPDGEKFASGSCGKQDSFYECIEGEVLLWDLVNQQPIGLPFIGHTKEVTNLTFSPDGKTLASGSEDTTIILWDLDPQSWIEQSCRRANRNFTRSEWEQYFPNDKDQYQKTCEQFPPEPPATSKNLTRATTATPGIIPSSPTGTVTAPGQPADTAVPGIRPPTYTAQIGDTFPCIARRYDISPDDLLMLNEVADDPIYGGAVYPGLVLTLPQTANPFPGTRALRNHPSTITVASANETLIRIACQFGDVDPSAIAQANGLSINATLVPGQQLSIP